MNVVTVPNVALEKAIANPMMNVKADLFVEHKIVDLDIQATTIVVPLRVWTSAKPIQHAMMVRVIAILMTTVKLDWFVA